MKKINLTMKKLFHKILSKAVQFEIGWAILSSVLVLVALVIQWERKAAGSIWSDTSESDVVV